MKTGILTKSSEDKTKSFKALAQLNNIAANHNGKCLSLSCKKMKQKLLWECKLGHRWYASVDSILYANSWCPFCAGNRKLTLFELGQIAAQKGGKCLAPHYVNSKTKILWQCKKGHQWYATAFSIKTRESWCPECYRSHTNN